MERIQIGMFYIEEENKKREEIRKAQEGVSLFIKAGAGAGKTTLLVNRIYEQLISGVNPEQLVAITFTNKAANELYERVYQMLQKKKEEVSSEEKERLQIVLSQMDRMHISTIHKFCLKIIKEFPFAIDMGLDVTISEESCDEQQQRFLDSWCCDLDKKIDEWNKNIENALDNYGDYTTKKQVQAMKKEYAIKPDFSKLNNICAHLIQEYQKSGTIGISNWEEKYEDLMEKARSFLSDLYNDWYNVIIQEIVQEDYEDSEEYESARNDKLRASLELLKEKNQMMYTLIMADTKKGRTEALEEYIILLYEGLISEDGIGQQVISTKKIEARLETIKNMKRRTEEHAQEEQKLLQQLEVFNQVNDWWSKVRESYIEKVKELSKAYKLLRIAMAKAVEKRLQDDYFVYEKKNRMICNDDMVYLALQIVKNEDVAKQIAKRYHTIYIDEYQDTDWQQAELFETLYKTSNETLNLVYVGDGKQAIYMFRGADSKYFYETEEEFKNSENKKVLELQANYRSNEAICDWVNQWMKNETIKNKKVFVGELEMHSESYSKNPTKGQIFGVYQMDVTQQLGTQQTGTSTPKMSDACKNAGKLVAKKVKELIDAHVLIYDVTTKMVRPVEPEDFLLLFWTKKYMKVFQKELDALHLQTSMTGGTDYSQIEPYQRLCSILNYVAESTPYYTAQVLKHCEGISNELLEEFKYQKDRMLPMNFVRYLLSKEDILFVTNEEKIAKEDIIADIFYAMEVAGERKYGTLKSLSSILHSEFVGENKLPLSITEKRGVRLMNIHKAKGLEGSIVICCEPHNTKGNDIVEIKNLEYVLFTRAKEALIFTQYPKLLISRKEENLNFDFINSLSSIETIENDARDVWEKEGHPLTSVEMTQQERIYLTTEDLEERIESLKQSSCTLITPSHLEKRTKRSKKEIIETEEIDEIDEAEETKKEKQKRQPITYTNRPYGSRFGTIIHRIMELALSKKEELLRWTKDRKKEETPLDEVKKILRDMVRFAVYEELKEPLTEKDRTDFGISTQEGNITNEAEAIICLIEEYAYCFVWSTYCNEEYRACFAEGWQQYTEFAFGYRTILEGKEVFIHGIMDFVAMDNKGNCVIFDYKTNRQRESETEQMYLERIRNHYQSQLEIYAKVIPELFDKVTEKIKADVMVYYDSSLYHES